LALGIRMFLLNLSIFFLTSLGEKFAKYGGKNLLHKREGKSSLFTISVSRFTLLEKKNPTTLLEADVDTVLVIEDGKSSLNHCSYKGYSWQIEFL
jgi:hypothetical protein